MRKPNCCERLSGTNKGAWSKQEDHKLIDYISTHGQGCWRSLPSAAGLQRCGQSCRPDIKRGHFDQDEEDLILKLHALLGNRWSLIAGRLPGRTDNEVKNYWNSQIRRKLLKEGIDPNNHRMHHIRSNYDRGRHIRVEAVVRGGDNNIEDGAVMSDEKSTDSSSNSIGLESGPHNFST